MISETMLTTINGLIERKEKINSVLSSIDKNLSIRIGVDSNSPYNCGYHKNFRLTQHGCDDNVYYDESVERFKKFLQDEIKHINKTLNSLQISTN